MLKPASAAALALVAAGCAQLAHDLRYADRPGLPCAANTCNADQLARQDPDPFGGRPVSYESIFGPQPAPGNVRQ